MRLTKTICGITAALTVLSSTAIAAQAEQSQLKLQTGNIGNINWNDSFKFYFGDGCFSDGSNFYRIGEKEISEWQNSGNFTYSNIEADLDITGLNWWSGSFDGEGEYVQLYKRDAENNVLERYVVHLDKASGKITNMYNPDVKWCYTRPDGYTVSYTNVNSNTLTLTVYDPTGKKTESTLTRNSGSGWSVYSSSGTGKYVGYVTWEKEFTQYDEYMMGYLAGNQVFYGICKDGSLEILRELNDYYDFSIASSGENYVSFYDTARVGRASILTVYSEESKEFFSLGAESATGFFNKITGGKIYSTKAIVEIKSGYGDSAKTQYALIDFTVKNSYNSVEPISKNYNSMSTNDGKNYLVQTLDDKWGYINDNGKELAVFDSAGAFEGDYAPVVKNGKAYLIDRNMNKVSEEIDGDSVSTRGDGLYFITNGDSIVFMTYSKQNETSEPTSNPTSQTTSETASTTTSETTSKTISETSSEPASEPTSQTGSDKNPATGFAFALIPVALIGGVSIAALKKRK